MKNNKQGFTMVELLVVIAVIAFIMTAAIYMINSARIKARDTKRLSDIKQLERTLKIYYNENGKYPGNPGNGTDDWYKNDLCTNGGSYPKFSTLFSGLINPLPNDPNNNNYSNQGCYWYWAKNFNSTGAQGYIIVMNPEDNNLLNSDMNCYPAEPYYYCIGENW